VASALTDAAGDLPPAQPAQEPWQRRGDTGEPMPLPAGTPLVWLDPPDGLPPEYPARATRYGWPTDMKVFPTPVAVGPDGPIDIDRSDVTLAARAVVAHLNVSGGGTDGGVPLGEGLAGTFAGRRHRPTSGGTVR
jgi:hypothetical protein